MNQQIDVWVNREDLRRIDARASPLNTELRDGQVLLAVDRFAFTSNNITYAVLGHSAGFWQFFPAPLPWGRIPVWGFADVVASQHQQIVIGERIFGFLPMSTHLVLEPARITATGFTDAAAHRSALFPIYNQYARRAAGEASDPQREDVHAVVRPLFFTSFVLDIHLADHTYFGARTVLLSSASSKTALGAAFLLRERRATRVCGLTSARHRKFVASTGCFDAVHTYDDLTSLELESPVVYVDFSGDAALRRAVFVRLGSSLVRSLALGVTHWNAPVQSEASPGVEAQAFSGPAEIKKLRIEWGAHVLQARLDAAEARFLSSATAWLEIERECGLLQVEQGYRKVLEGQTDPAQAFVFRIARPEVPVVEALPVLAEERAAMSFMRPQSDPVED